jgi:phosphoribosyl-AMP cyclohydrolase
MNPDDVQYNQNGLVPAIIQDAAGKTVLMLGYMNAEALRLTLQTGRVHFWSRSRQKMWLKGETSGNFLYFREAWLDCDRDALLVLVDPAGPACHTGARSCFETNSKMEQ